jgi:hypothetical protein
MLPEHAYLSLFNSFKSIRYKLIDRLKLLLALYFIYTTANLNNEMVITYHPEDKSPAWCTLEIYLTALI